MNERERILDLVKKGVLSTDEALDLLESIAKAKDTSQIEKVAEEVKAENKAKEAESKNETNEETSHEEGLEELSKEAKQVKSESDEIEVEIQGLKKQLNELNEAIKQLDTKEELDVLTEEDAKKRKILEKEAQALLFEQSELQHEKNELDDKLQEIKRKQFQQVKEKVVGKFDIPDDWREQATEKITSVSEKVMGSSSKVSELLKKTVKSVSELINDNVELKDINIKVPGVASTKFEKEYHFDPTDASIVDIKVANGKIVFEESSGDSVVVKAAIKLYGKFSNENSEEIFESRSDLSVSEEKISIQVPNKRIYSDLVISLPSRVYDYTSVKMLNGSLIVNDIKGKDFYLKVSNGDIDVTNISATMLEIEGVNGDISIKDGQVRDTVIESLNGDIKLKTTPETVSISLVNGDIKLSFDENTLKSVKAHLVNGDIKLSAPKNLGLSATAKSNLGSIKQRLSEIEITQEKRETMNQILQFERFLENNATLDLETATGSIYLKDSDM